MSSSREQLVFERTPLLLGLSGGVAITSAIVAMNTLPTKMSQMMSGVPLFTLGWVLVILGFVKNNTRDPKHRRTLALGSVVVYAAAMMSRMMMDNNMKGSPMMMANLAFIAAWITVGITMGIKNSDVDVKYSGLLTPLMVITAMMSVNKLERPTNLASGPGMPLFMLSWVVLSIINSSVV